MANKKIVHPVTVEKLEKINGDIIILNGGRNTGKSYSVKLLLLREAFKAINEAGQCMKKFIYLRRFHDDTKDIFSQTYFDDINISLLTDGRFNSVIVFRHEIYFGNIDENGKQTKDINIGRVCSMTKVITYKSQVFANYNYIVFEEFVSDQYTVDEPNKLLNFISTVFRDRKGVVYMIGNLVSRFNPYFREWELTGAMGQALDTIDSYKFSDVVIKVWRCPDGVNLNKMAFGHAKKAIDGVEYESTVQPHLDIDREKAQLIYTVVLQHNELKYLMELLSVDNNIIWYVSPKTTDIKKGTRVVTNKFTPDMITTNSFIGLNENEGCAFDLLRRNKVCFSDNLTGTEFKQIVKFY